MNNCDNCVHGRVCRYFSGTTGCDSFQAKESVIELPCSLGVKIYRINRINRYNNIVEEVVVGVHLSRKSWKRSRGNDDCYICVRSVITDGVSRITFEDFKRNAFFSREEAEASAKERSNE